MRSADEPGHAGYGLYVASELAVRNGGTFRLTSGSQSLLRYRVYKGGHGTWSRKTQEESHQAWNGTIVSLVLDLENLLPISEVYATLPLPDGYASEDFFD